MKRRQPSPRRRAASPIPRPPTAPAAPLCDYPPICKVRLHTVETLFALAAVETGLILRDRQCPVAMLGLAARLHDLAVTGEMEARRAGRITNVCTQRTCESECERETG